MTAWRSGLAGIIRRIEVEGGSYQALVHATQADGIDLADVGSFCLEELLECDAVLRRFSGCDADAIWLESFADGCVSEDIVWICRFWIVSASHSPMYGV